MRIHGRYSYLNISTIRKNFKGHREKVLADVLS